LGAAEASHPAGVTGQTGLHRQRGVLAELSSRPASGGRFDDPDYEPTDESHQFGKFVAGARLAPERRSNLATATGETWVQAVEGQRPIVRTDQRQMR